MSSPTTPPHSDSLPLDDERAVDRVVDAYNEACVQAHKQGVPGPDINPFLDGLGERARVAARRAIVDIPGFAVLGEQGRGGMGKVYRATEEASGKPVAVKVLESAELRRLPRLEDVLPDLKHRNLVPMRVLRDEEHKQAFLVMPLVDGGNLRTEIGRWTATAEHCRPEQVEDRERMIAALVEKLAKAIHYLHERTVIHRDLKPANILIEANDEPLVCDFGLARRSTDPTLTNAVVGTPRYMAPEQLLGSRDLTLAVDVYALGAILYELLTGHPPFADGGASEPTIQHLRTTKKLPPLPHDLNHQLPTDGDLGWISLQCLHLDPGKRISADTLAKHLLAFQEGRPVRPPKPAPSLADWFSGPYRQPSYASRWAWALRIEGVTNPLAHLGMFLLLLNGAPWWALWACLLGCDTLLGWAIWLGTWSRRRYRLTSMERDILYLWGAVTAGEVLLFALHCPLFSQTDPQSVVRFYATWAVMRAVLFFIEGHLFWRGLRIISIAYLVAAVVMPWLGLYAALVYGFITGGWFFVHSFRKDSQTTEQEA